MDNSQLVSGKFYNDEVQGSCVHAGTGMAWLQRVKSIGKGNSDTVMVGLL